MTDLRLTVQIRIASTDRVVHLGVADAEGAELVLAWADRDGSVATVPATDVEKMLGEAGGIPLSAACAILRAVKKTHEKNSSSEAPPVEVAAEKPPETPKAEG